MPVSPVTNVFAGNPLDRAGDRRANDAWMAEQLAHPAGTAIALWKGALLAAPGADRLAILPLNQARSIDPAGERLLFLGLDGDEAPVFALEMDAAADPTLGPLAGLGTFMNLRDLAAVMPRPQAGMAATARSLFEWRRRHRFCANCGQPTAVVDGGWRRRCPVCEAEHFPRVDPCVIMLPTYGDRCLVGRQASWDPGRYSALAGFLEPGESVEEACAREVKEESGLTVISVEYHSSQPWPWPSNLMIGLLAEVSDDQAAPDQTELEAVAWLTRGQVRDLLNGALPDMSGPGDIAIAQRLLAAFAQKD